MVLPELETEVQVTNSLYGTMIQRLKPKSRVDRLGEKAPIGLLLAAVGSLKFGFDVLLLFGILLESLSTTAHDLRRLFAGYFFFVLLLQNQSIHRRKMDYPSSR